MKHDLLIEPLVSWRGRDRVRQAATLPGVLAALSRGDVVDFPRARAHQQHPWSMFLTQLAAIALRRAGLEKPPRDEAAWRKLLLALTDERHEAWCLVVEDLSQPAFFQPPVPEGALRKPGKVNKKTGKETPGDEWKVAEYPDDLDVLVTSKKHDVKDELISPDDVEAWTYALCSLQTTQGYPGRGYNGISRMNGGYGNRPRVAVSADPAFSARFLRDVTVLLAEWPVLLERGFQEGGLELAWTQAWDGTTSLTMPELTPHFVEICWRLRLVKTVAALAARYTTTECRRCLSEVDHGDTGDPWAPVSRASGAILTPGPNGYPYRLLVELLFSGEYAPAPAQELRSTDPDAMLFCASALARGQGKTDGLHERTLPIAGKTRRALFSKVTRDALGERARSWIKQASEMRSNVLFPALKQIALGQKAPADDFDTLVDERFFEVLFATIELDDQAALALWEDELVTSASAELERAIEAASLPDARYWRAITAARGMFYGCLKKRFPDAVARRKRHTQDATDKEEFTA